MRGRDGAREVDARPEQAEPAHLLVVAVEQVEVELVEALGVAVLAVEELHGLHAGEVLGQVGVRAAGAQAHGAERVADAQAQVVERHEQQRHDRQRHEREAPVDDEHVDHQADDQADVGDQADDAVGHGGLDGLDVAGDAGDQAADRGAVEEPHVELLDLAEGVAAQVVDHVLADPRHGVGVAVAQAEVEHAQAQVDQHDVQQAREPLVDVERFQGAVSATM
jgi:hypothetical protein